MDSSAVEQRLEFLEFDEHTRTQLKDARRISGEAIDLLLDRFYTHILQQPALRNLFEDADAIERARRAQKQYWLDSLLNGQRGPAYFDRAEQVGKTHARIELTPNWYMGAYCYMLNQLVDLVAAEYEHDARTVAEIVKALNKAAILDMELVIDSYLEEKDAAMRAILRRVTLFAEDAKHMQGDLRHAATALQTQLHELVDRAESSKAETGRFRYEIEAAARLSQTPRQATVQSSEPGTSKRLEDATARVEALADSAADTAAKASDVLARASGMLEEIERLNSRLEQLQFGDKLYYDEARPKNLLSQIKGLVTGNG